MKVKTDGENFAAIVCEDACLDLWRDEDSPNYPNSWMWMLGLDINGTTDEASLHEIVEDAVASIDKIIEQLTTMSEYLKAYEVFGRESEVSE